MREAMPDLSRLRDYEYPDIAERFYQETAHHELTVLLDQGLYRHLRMMPPKTMSSSYWYEIITWPGNLVFRGDGESFAFARVQDMFEFFRSGLYKDGSVHINATYWAEKLTSNRECVKTYDEEKFKAYAADILKEAEADHPGVTKAWREATEGWPSDYDIHFEQGAYEALHNFRYGEYRVTAKCSCGLDSGPRQFDHDAEMWAKIDHKTPVGSPRPGHEIKMVREYPFSFELSEVDFKDYDWWFVWSLYGILEAIRAYDDPKSPRRLIKDSSVEDVAVAGSEV